MACKCSWCKECSAGRKLEQLDEPRAKPSQGANHKAYPKGRKQRLDQLKQAHKDFWYWFESDQAGKASAFNCEWKELGHKRGPWRCWHDMDRSWLQSHLKKYLKALKACVDAGDVPQPSWYGTSH